MSLRNNILTYIINHPHCTDEDIAAGCNALDASVRAARNGLVKLGLVENTGKRLGVKTWKQVCEECKEDVLALPHSLSKLVTGKLYNVDGKTCRTVMGPTVEVRGKASALVGDIQLKHGPGWLWFTKNNVGNAEGKHYLIEV